MNKVTEKILRIISRGPRGSYDNPAPPLTMSNHERAF